MLDRSIPPPAQRITNVDFTRAESTSLSNGIPIHVIHAGEHEIIRLEIVLKSGRWYENRSGIAYFTSQMLLEGTSGYTSRALADLFEFHGAHVSVNSGIDFNILVVYVMASKLNEIIEIVKQCLLDPVFPERELEIMKDIQRQQLRINSEKNNYVAGKTLRKLLFGEGHPYGRALEIEDIDDGLDVGLLKEYYSRNLLNEPEIIISGNISQGVMNSMEVFNAFPLKSAVVKSVGETGLLGEKELFIERKHSVQSSLRLGRRIIGKTHSDFIGLIVLNELFGGFFGSRLMKNIREDKGYTYGIHSSLVSHIHDDFWVIGTDVKKEHADDTVQQVLHEMERLKTEPVDKDELDPLRNYMMGNFISSLETSFALADKFKNIHFFDQDYGFYDRYLDTINSITPQRLMELAREYMVPEEFRKVIVG